MWVKCEFILVIKLKDKHKVGQKAGLWVVVFTLGFVFWRLVCSPGCFLSVRFWFGSD